MNNNKQWHIKISTEGQNPEDTKAIEKSKKIFKQYYDKCHSIYGITAFFDFHGKDILQKISLSDKYYSFGPQFPDLPQLPGKSTHALIPIDQLKATNITDYLSKSYIVFIYQMWEEHFRIEIANNFSIKKGDVTSDFFGDLRRLRNSIIHNNAEILRKDIENLKILELGLNKQYNKGKLVISQNMLGHIIEQLNLMEVKVALNNQDVKFKMCPVRATSSSGGQRHLIHYSNRSDSFDIHYKQGVANYNSNQYAKALVNFNKAIELRPEHAVAYYSRGNTRNKLNQDKRKEIVDFTKAIELKPDFIEAYINRGEARYKLGQYIEATEDYDKVIELKLGMEAEAYFGRGSSKIQLYQYKEAIVDFTKAIELKPDYVETYNSRGYSKAELGKYKEAIIDLNKAIELAPNHAYAYLNRGMVKGRLKQHREAVVDFNKAIELEPNDALAYCNRGSARIQLRQYKKAIVDSNKAIDIES